MDREIRLTEDGSHTLFVTALDEPYHSIHGALQESSHIFIKQRFQTIQKSPLNILELGLGTGLNMMLSLVESSKIGVEVYYHAVEKYPLVPSEYLELNFEKIIPNIPTGSLIKMHEAPSEEEYVLADGFKIYKEQADFRSMNPKGSFDLVYFDAFAPEKQPELWSTKVFSNIARMANPGAILVTYSSKSDVRRALISCGFNVTKVPGPPGKVEMIRAIRI